MHFAGGDDTEIRVVHRWNVLQIENEKVRGRTVCTNRPVRNQQPVFVNVKRYPIVRLNFPMLIAEASNALFQE